MKIKKFAVIRASIIAMLMGATSSIAYSEEELTDTHENPIAISVKFSSGLKMNAKVSSEGLTENFEEIRIEYPSIKSIVIPQDIEPSGNSCVNIEINDPEDLSQPVKIYSFHIKKTEGKDWGFRASDSSIIVNTDDSIAYCGLDITNGKIIEKHTDFNQRLYLGALEAANFLAHNDAITTDSIFSELYKEKAETFKQLWKTPFTKSAAGIAAITGLFKTNLEKRIPSSLIGKFPELGIFSIDIEPKNFLQYECHELQDCKCKIYPELQSLDSSPRIFVLYNPLIFTVTFDEFQAIQTAHPDIDCAKEVYERLNFIFPMMPSIER